MLVHQLCVPALTQASEVAAMWLCDMLARLASHFAAVPRVDKLQLFV